MRPANLGGRIALAAALGLAALVSGPARSQAGEPSPLPSAESSTGSLELRVVDAVSGDVVPWANLIRQDSSGGWLADGEGVARVAGLAPGTIRLRAFHIAYEPSNELSFSVLPGRPTKGVVALRPRPLQMEAVEIRGDRESSLREIADGGRLLSTEEMSRLPNPRDDVFQAVRVLPGVSADDVGSEFRLRGGGIEETLVRIDGMEVRNLFHGRDFGGITGILPSSVVRGMDVYPGGFPARFGGRLSGAIDIGLRSKGEAGLHGLFAADAISARALTEVHGDDTSLFVSAREGYLDQVLDALQDHAVIHPAYRDLLARAVYHPDPARTLSVNYLRSEDHLLFEDGIDLHFVDADYLDHYLWTSFDLTPSERFRASGTLHGARSSRLRRVEEGGRDDHRQSEAGGRLELSWFASRSHLLRIGGAIDHEWGNYSLGGTDVVHISGAGIAEEIEDFAEAGRFRRRRSSAFLEDSWKPVSRMVADLGVRASHDTDSEILAFDPRASVAFDLGRSVALHGAWGEYSQAPVRELGGSSEKRVISDRPERAEHLLVGLEKRFRETRVGIDAYEKRFHELDGIISHTRDGITEPIAITHGVARGIELSLSRSGENAQWWFGYAFGRSEWGNESRTFARDFDRLHAFTMAHTYRLGPGWDIGINWSWHTGSPYTEERWSWNEEQADWILDEGAPNARRFPDYHRVDVRIRRHFQFEGWAMSVYAEGLNLTNHDNVVFYSWTFREHGGEKVPERITRTGVPGVPSVGLEVRF